MVPIVTMSEELEPELPNDEREEAHRVGEVKPAEHTSTMRLLLSTSDPAMSLPAKYAVFLVVGMRALKPWVMARVKFSGQAM